MMNLGSTPSVSGEAPGFAMPRRSSRTNQRTPRQSGRLGNVLDNGRYEHDG
jgi:hypothetical protein